MDANQPKDRMILDFDYVIQDIEKVLDDIRSIRADRSFESYVGKGFLKTIKEYETLIHNRLNDAFNLVIVGDFKRGKSTFINALIGERILPSAVTPETVTINKLSYAENPKVEAVLKNGRRAALDLHDLNRDELDRIAKQFPAPIDYIDVKENNDFLRGVSIIDTPGIGDLFKAFDEQVADYLLNADAVIYLVSAKAPLSITEQTFLSASVMPQSFSRVLLVINMSDCLDTIDDIEKVKKMANEKAQDINSNIYVYSISALDELSRKLNLKRPNPELAEYLENNFLELENALQNDILMKKEIIKSTRGIALTQNLLSMMSSRIKLLKGSLKANVDKLTSVEETFLSQNSELEASVLRHKQSLSADLEEMKIEAKGWIRDFLTRVNLEIKNIQTSADQSDLERHFQFYMDDIIKQAFITCIERHKKEISDKLATEARELSKEVSNSTYGSINAQIADCISDVSWTKVDTAMFVAGDILQLGSQLGIIYIAVQAVAGFIRQQVVKTRQKDYLGPILQDFDLISIETLSKVDEVYNQLKTSAVNKLDDIYQNQVLASMEAIKQAKEITEIEGIKTEEVINYLDSVLETITGLDETLKKYN